MLYAGNPSLSSDIQKRVLGTFEQTLGLAGEGSRQEALLGCDFVLRMDPQFEPARQLQERLRNSAGAVRVDDLLGSPGSPAAAEDSFGGLDLPDLPDFSDAPTAVIPPPVGNPAGNGSGLRGRFQVLLDSRRHEELLTLAGQEQAALGADPELMRIAGVAQERMEAEPYVNKFLSAGRDAARQGKQDEVARAAEKIRALDPTHPGIAELQAASAPAVAAPAVVPASAFPDSPSFGGLDSESAEPAVDMGFDLSLDEPDFGTGLPDLSFDSPELNFDSPAGSLDFGGLGDSAAGISLDPELVSAADFAGSMGGGSTGEGNTGETETDRRIQQLLNEGQTAHDAGDLQGAIDAWSRIFLIDIDHQEAARRIEQARRVKAESERQAEEVFHEGLAKIDAGDLEGAKQTFLRVLEIQPSYFAAREYLQQLESGVVPSTRPAPRQELQALQMPADILDAGGDLKEEILIPPDPSEVAAAERQKPRPKAAPARQGRARKLFLMVGSAVLVLALGGGAFVYMNKDRLFPNSEAGDPTMPIGAPAQDPIARAQDLHKNGRTEIAIRQLSVIPPDDPAHARAQELIAEWKSAAPAPAVPGSGTAEPGTGVPAALPVDNARLEVLTAARQAYQQGSYLDAIERLETAAEQGQLDPSDAQLLASARSQIEPLASQIDLVKQHEWEHALRDLWRLHEAEPGNRDVTRLMVDSYYNMALRDLQRMDTAKAIENLREASGLNPDDRELRRQLLFAQTYQERPKDLLYRIYVKHLPLR